MSFSSRFPWTFEAPRKSDKKVKKTLEEVGAGWRRMLARIFFGLVYPVYNPLGVFFGT